MKEITRRHFIAATLATGISLCLQIEPCAQTASGGAQPGIGEERMFSFHLATIGLEGGTLALHTAYAKYTISSAQEGHPSCLVDKGALTPGAVAILKVIPGKL